MIEPGDIITDGLVVGVALAKGTIKFGRKGLPVWRVKILTSHQAGQEGAMLEDKARLVASNPEWRE